MNKVVISLLKSSFKIHKKLLFNQTLRVNQSCFSTLKSDNNPNQVPEQIKKLMSQQQSKSRPQQLPILNDISKVKTVEQLPQIYKKLIFMTKQNRQIALRYLLSAIYQHKIQFQAVQQKSLNTLLKQYPHIKLQSQIFQINFYVHKIQTIKRQLGNHYELISDRDVKQKQILQYFNIVNDKYYQTFNETLKQISPMYSTKSKATLYKHFAEYNFQHLFNPEIVHKDSSLFDTNIGTLKKARQFLIESLKCHQQILLHQHKKLQSDQMSTLKQQSLERHQIKLNAIKQNIRKIVESIGECLYAIFKILNKEHKILKDPFEHRNRKIELLSLIDTYSPLYSIIPGIKQLSMMYYKLYKIKIQAKFTSVNQPKTPEQVKTKIKQTVEEYSRLLRECQDCLDESIKSDNFNNIKQISATMLSIKYMIGKNLRKSEIQLKNALAESARFIVDKMKTQYKKPAQHYILSFIKELIQVQS